MRILKLKLRGSIGIKKGLGLEEIEIDFTQFQPGLIALTGRNGSGKTTIMENLHPYRCMVSRDGSLQSHFYLKDSYRILDFVQDGHKYQSKILIDGLTGGSEAYLFCNDKPINDGKLTTYDEVIEQLLGSKDLFFNSVFSGQKSKGIAELKPGDRRKLFYELLNLDIYETYLEKAKAQLKSNELALSEIEGQISLLTTNQESLEELNESKIQYQKEINIISNELSDLEKQQIITLDEISAIEVNIQLLKNQSDELSKDKMKLNSLEKQNHELDKSHQQKILRYDSDIEECKKLIERKSKLVDSKDEIKSKIAEIECLENSLIEHRENYNAIQKQIADHQKEYSNNLQILSSLEKKVNSLLIVRNGVKSERDKRKSDIQRSENSTKIIDEVPCSSEVGSNCKFLINAYENKNALLGLIEVLQEIEQELSNKEKELSEAELELRTQKQLINEQFTLKNKVLSDKLAECLTAIDITTKLITDLDKNKLLKTVNELTEAAKDIEVLQEKIRAINTLIDETNRNYKTEIERNNKEIKVIQDKICDFDDTRLMILISKKDNIQKHIIKIREDVELNKTIINTYQKQVNEIDYKMNQLKANADKVEQLKVNKSTIENEIKDWTFLTKAFDKTGIPILKLENSGVEITSIANELLSLFENKFRIVFETTKLKSDKKSYKESFDINIVEEDGVCEISNKSGGQQVWLETAIQLAISLVVRNQGRNIQTAFLDEKDGALDLDNALNYVQMIRKAHDMSGVYNTFIITHRQELLDYIPQQVKLNNGILEIRQ